MICFNCCKVYHVFHGISSDFGLSLGAESHLSHLSDSKLFKRAAQTQMRRGQEIHKADHFPPDVAEAKFKGYAHVSFRLTGSTDKAVALSGTMLSGRRIKIDFARENRADGLDAVAKAKTHKAPFCTSVYIANLPEGTTPGALKKEFRSCGPIESCDLIYNKVTGMLLSNAVSVQCRFA